MVFEKKTCHCHILTDRHLEYLEKKGDEAAKFTREVSNITRGNREILGQISLGAESFSAVTRSGKYRLVYDAHNTMDRLNPNYLVYEEGGEFTGDATAKVDATQAYEFAGVTYDFYQELFNRKSIDDRDMELVSTVRYRRNYRNAFWDGRTMTYGDGMTKCIDVVGHEMTHGVTQYEANLIYENQPGALNEHFSDVMGILVKQRFQNESASESNWLLGERIVPQIDAVRSLKDPGSCIGDAQINDEGNKINHMDNFYHGSEDNGGVHMNSGIPNKAFYLVATKIGGNAWDIAGKIWYIVLRDKLQQRSSFQEAANYTFEVAKSFFDSNVQDAVVDGWSKVGINIGTNLASSVNSLLEIRHVK